MKNKKKSKMFTSEYDSLYEIGYIWGKSSTQFFQYIIGYKTAADTIIDSALEKRDTKILDTHVFPACFLYRQYLELALKNIYLDNSIEPNSKKIQTINECSHNLLKIWVYIKPLILKDFLHDNSCDIDKIESYIVEFAKEDNDSFAFRYPITKKMELVHREEKIINLRILRDRMYELEEFFSTVAMAMSEFRAIEQEIELENRGNC
jgi:hypothetical protein